MFSLGRGSTAGDIKEVIPSSTYRIPPGGDGGPYRVLRIRPGSAAMQGK